MIEIVDKYEQLFRFIKDLEFLYPNSGMDRFLIKGYQKHGDKTLEIPEDGGCYYVSEMLCLFEEVLDKALMQEYQLKFEREKSKKLEDL